MLFTSRPVDRAAIDDRLEQSIIEVIFTGIDRASALAIVFEFSANIGVQKIRARDRLREYAEAGGIVRLQFLEEFGRRTVLRAEQ